MKKAQILSTTDYKKFESDPVNRSVKPPNLQKIKESLSKNGWLAPYPMHVVSRNGKLIIKDGQHRFNIAQKLSIPVLYVACEDCESVSVADINIAQSPWNAKDFATSYANQGNVAYAQLLTFAEMHRLPLGVCAKLLSNSLKSKDCCTKSLRDGTFKIHSSNKADEIAGIINHLKNKLRITFAAHRTFIEALAKAVSVEGFCVQTFIDRVRSCPTNLTLEPNTERFLEAIEKTYNYRTAKAKCLPVRFLAMNL